MAKNVIHNQCFNFHLHIEKDGNICDKDKDHL
jgi:hypothetical protein